MTVDQWILAFNRYLTERMENIDDDVFLQVGIVERYLLAWGKLPEKQGDLDRVYKAVELYLEAVQVIGDFPTTGD